VYFPIPDSQKRMGSNYCSLIVLFISYASSYASNCDYVSDSVQYVNVSEISSSGPLFVGRSPLPDRVQGVFWFVDDGGDALISLGSGPNNKPDDECNSGVLTRQGNQMCTSISTVRPGGWTFQAEATPKLFGGKFPSIADEFYRTCGSKWTFCFDAATSGTPAKLTASATATRGLPCVNVFSLASTTGEYQGTKYGGHYWRVTTKALGIVPLPSFVPGDFDMIQVMDGNGQKIQPAWNKFAEANEQIVFYTGESSN